MELVTCIVAILVPFTAQPLFMLLMFEPFPEPGGDFAAMLIVNTPVGKFIVVLHWFVLLNWHEAETMEGASTPPTQEELRIMPNCPPAYSNAAVPVRRM